MKKFWFHKQKLKGQKISYPNTDQLILVSSSESLDTVETLERGSVTSNDADTACYSETGYQYHAGDPAHQELQNSG